MNTGLRSFDNCYARLILKSNKKFDWLLLKHENNQLKKIKDITYFCKSKKDEPIKNFFFNIPKNIDNKNIIKAEAHYNRICFIENHSIQYIL